MISLEEKDTGLSISFLNEHFIETDWIRTYRDDMGGVGSFTKENRTLHVAGLKRTANLEEIVTAHFAEWGELEAGSVYLFSHL